MTIYDYIGYIPSLSANNKNKAAASQQLTAVSILYTYKLGHIAIKGVRCKIRLKC